MSTALANFNTVHSRRWMSAVSEQTLVAYVNLMTLSANHLECLAPLRHLAARNGKHAAESGLRIATIELKDRGNADAAIDALERIQTPLDDRQLRKRRHLMKVAEQQRRNRLVERLPPESAAVKR